MARKQTTKPAQSTKAETLMICIGKTEKASTEVNAMSIPVVNAAELVASDSTKAHLCLNILAGHVDPAIREAHAKRGGLKRLFPGMANPEANALRVCLDTPREKLVAGWSKYTVAAKRVRNISLQALAKSVREPSGETVVTLRDSLKAWIADNDKVINAKAFPQSLVDIFIEFDLIEGEAE